MRESLARRGLADPITWGGLVDRQRDVRVQITEIFGALGLLDIDPAEVTEVLDTGVELARVAQAASQTWASQMANRSEYQCAIDGADGRPVRGATIARSPKE